MTWTQRFWLALLALAAPSFALARDNITINAQSEGQSASRGFSSVDQIFNSLSTSTLSNSLPGYTSNSAATAQFDLRGVPALASFAANSSALRVQIPAANGLDRVFEGNTREESARLFQRFMQGSNGSASLNALLRAGTHSSPIDPISGGPNSALTQLAVSDFARSVQGSLGDRTGFGIGARVGSFSAAGYDSWNVTAPIDASFRLSERDTLSFDAPFAYTNAGGATSYSGNIGALYRRRVLENWDLQASGRLGAAGSINLGAGSAIFGLGLASTLRLPISESWRLTIVNGLNYVSTLPSSIGKAAVDYSVANTIFRNGLILTRATGLSLAGFPLALSFYAVDTRFAGSPVFVRNFQEFGVFVSPGRESNFGFGLQVMTGDRGLFGVMVSTGVKF